MTVDRSRIDQNRLASEQLLSLDPGSRKSFQDRAEILFRRPEFPLTKWYHDEDFVRAYQTACHWKDEADRLRGLLKAAPLCQACLGNPMVQECQPWCREAQKIKRADQPARNP